MAIVIIFVTYDISLIRMEMMSRLKVIRNAGAFVYHQMMIWRDYRLIISDCDIYRQLLDLEADESDDISLCI